jgi:hypothetical protein
VRGVDVDDQPFVEQAVLDNFSSGGLYVRLARQAQHTVRLFGLIRFSVVSTVDGSAAYLALHGMAQRIEPRPGGVFGTAIRLVHYRFVYVRLRAERDQTAWLHSVGRTAGRGYALQEVDE